MNTETKGWILKMLIAGRYILILLLLYFTVVFNGVWVRLGCLSPAIGLLIQAVKDSTKIKRTDQLNRDVS
jgi:hypothetical protein